MAKPYRTAITSHEKGRIYVYGYDLINLAGKSSFARTIYLILKGQMPDKNSEAMLDTMLTMAIDHGVEPSSVVAARNIYSAGNPLNTAVAGGVMALGEFHGGAIEAAMENFKKYQPLGFDEMNSDFTKSGRRIHGFGHRFYTTDPRTEKLVSIAKELGFFGKYVKFALECEEKLSIGGKKLPLNIDGIFAALLCEMGFNSKAGNGFFIIARVPGIVAHVVEESLREKPVRRLREEDVEYDGPRPREDSKK